MATIRLCIVTPTALPSKLGLVAAAPVSSHLVSLAAIVAVDRGPGPVIAHRSGVVATGKSEAKRS